MVKEKVRIKIEWTDKAKYQLFDILDYWTNRNKSKKYSDKILDELEVKLKFIKQNPLASVTTNYPNTRKCAMGYFSIVYNTKLKLTEYSLPLFGTIDKTRRNLMKYLKNK